MEENKFDVLVAGLGTSGVIAAISAARCGLKVLAVEQLSSPGGTQTFGMVTPMMETGLQNREFINSAIGEEIRNEITKRGYCEQAWFDPVMLGLVLEEKLTEAGIDILYNTSVINVENKEGYITKVDIFNTGGIRAVKAKTFIDCTGNADVAKICGVKIMSGNSKGVNQSASLRFEMANVDISRLREYLISTGQKFFVDPPLLQICSVDAGFSEDFNKRAEKAAQEGRLTELEISHIQFFTIPGRPGVISFNCPETGSGKKVSSPEEVTQRLMKGRKSIGRIAAFMKADIPGFEYAYINGIASLLGIRESERIVAEYEYGIADITARKRFKDTILRSNYPVDVHGAASEQNAPLEFRKVEPEEEYFEYPYRSIVPKPAK